MKITDIKMQRSNRTVYALGDNKCNIYSALLQDCSTNEEELSEVAKKIVISYNSHAALVSALKDLLGMVELDYAPENKKVVAAYSALKLAKGE